jgi:hypothetical protein
MMNEMRILRSVPLWMIIPREVYLAGYTPYKFCPFTANRPGLLARHNRAGQRFCFLRFGELDDDLDHSPDGQQVSRPLILFPENAKLWTATPSTQSGSAICRCPPYSSWAATAPQPSTVSPRRLTGRYQGVKSCYSLANSTGLSTQCLSCSCAKW